MGVRTNVPLSLQRFPGLSDQANKPTEILESTPNLLLSQFFLLLKPQTQVLSSTALLSPTCNCQESLLVLHVKSNVEESPPIFPSGTPVQRLHRDSLPLPSHHGTGAAHMKHSSLLGLVRRLNRARPPQASLPEFELWNPRNGRKELILVNCLLTSTCLPWHTHPHGRNAIHFKTASQCTQSNIYLFSLPYTPHNHSTLVTVFQAYSSSIWVSNTCCSFCLEHWFPDYTW